MDSRAFALLLGLAVLAAAVASGSCDGEEDVGPGSPDTGSLPLELKFDVPSEVRVGESVPFRLTVTNAGEEPLELGLGGREDAGYPASFQFFIETADSEEVTCKLCANRIADLSLSFRTLQPGEELELGWDWDQTDNDLQPAPPGMYSVYGTFNAGVGSEEEFDIQSEVDIDMETERRELVLTP